MQHRTHLTELTRRASGIALGFAVATTISSAAVRASAQAFPFPSSNQPGNGTVTTTVLTTHELRAQYARWKQLFIATCPNNQLRVQYPENVGPANDTRSEGIGYGMLIAAYMGDQQTFQGLRNFYLGHLDARGLMNWRYNDCNNLGAGGQGSAADADVDAAMSLIVASKQWPTGTTFAADATQLMNSIRGSLFDNNGCPGILLAGTTFTNCGCINPSYIPVGYYPEFAAAQAAQAQVWNTARTASYAYFNVVNDNRTGLVPAWSSSNNLQIGNGCTPQVGGGGQPNQFQADAARTPWRVSVDNAWSGNPSAKAFLQSIATFAKTQPIVNIVDLYNLDGTPQHGMVNGALDADGFRSTFTMGGFATAMTASGQDDLDNFTGAWQSMYLPGDNLTPHAFNSSLAMLYGLLVTGNMWDPNGPAPGRVKEPTLNPQGTNLLKNGDFDEGMQNWSFANLNDPATPGLRAEGYAMHKDGELHIIVPRAAARPQDPWEVRLSQPVSLQAGQKYVMSVKARAATPRSLHVAVEIPNVTNGVIASMGNHQDAMAPIMVGTDMQTYDWVFTSPMTVNANFEVDSADSIETLIIDDATLATTDLPESVAGDLAGTPPPTGSDPGTTPPPGGGTTPPAGNGSTPGAGSTPGGGNLGTAPNQTDATGGGAVGGLPVGAGASVNGAMPPVPNGSPAKGTCTVDSDCGGPYKCSMQLGLCYETTYGYVWSANQNAWTQPPSDVLGCGPDYVYWPLQRGCYDPKLGYAFDPNTLKWVYVGDNYTAGRDPVTNDGGCSVSTGSERGGAGWLLAGLAGAATVIGGRRRRSRG